ncbi:MAG: TIR domain-containing protein [Chitinophagales bacterium]|nr:TIR domain-containing protein [Chitinophagales bacterium]
MARRVFFSFHYKNDVWRANQVRNSWVTQGKEAAGFIDSADFEKLEKEGEDAVKRWINNQLNGTSVTVVLIGSETSSRKYVRYELQKSYEKGNGIVGVLIHNLKDKDGKTSTKGDTTFGELGKDKDGNPVYFFQIAKTYDYIDDNGYKNLGNWIETSAK